MTYKVVPFNASISKDQGVVEAAHQLEELLRTEATDGWVYIRLETIPTYVAGTQGCFGIGAIPATNRSYTVAVFRK